MVTRPWALTPCSVATATTNTPLPAGIHLEKSEEPVALDTKTYYQQIIGTLIYATIGTRPNIAFAAMRLSQFNNNPMKEHIKYAKYVLRYLKGTKELKIKYDYHNSTTTL